jgi:hypothetical protein
MFKGDKNEGAKFLRALAMDRPGKMLRYEQEIKFCRNLDDSRDVAGLHNNSWRWLRCHSSAASGFCRATVHGLA